MPRGDAFTDAQVRDIGKSVAAASSETGLEFSVYVGDVGGNPRIEAERLHAALGERAPDAVLVVVAPGDRVMEIVTGTAAARRVSDRACTLAAYSMSTAFSGGDLVGGIVTGLRMLAEAAGRPISSRR